VIAPRFTGSVACVRSISMRSDSRPHDSRERIVPIGTSSIVAASLYEISSRPIRSITWRRSWGNSGESTIEIAQRQPRRRIGCRCREWPRIVELDGAFARAASDAVYILVMHKGEEPGAKVGTALPAALVGNRPDEGVLDEIVCPGHVAGQRKSISSQPRDFFIREVDRIRSSYSPMFSTNCQPSVAPQREWNRRHLDYCEAQSFQDLLFCRSLRLIGNELHAGLAGSPWISVQDLQTHCATPSAPTPIEHASKVRSRVASETTYSGWANERTSRT
jgi:hypothetical protein